MKFRLTREARRELSALLARYASASPAGARRLRHEVYDALGLLAAGHGEGPHVRLLGTSRSLRRWLVEPLALYYDREGRTVVVRRVRHQRDEPIANP